MGLFSSSKTTTSVVNETNVTVNPEIINNNEINVDDSRLQGILDATIKGNEQSSKAQLVAAQAQLESAQTTAKALETGLMRAAIIGALATVAVQFGPKLLRMRA